LKFIEDKVKFVCQITESKSAPYTRFISGLEVSLTSFQLVECRLISEKQLLVSGDRERLSLLSKTVANFATDWREGEHLHIEHFDGHIYLSPNSISIVLSHL
jgi:hypothetical protein